MDHPNLDADTAGSPRPERGGDASPLDVVRSEEELAVSTVRRPVELVRLTKYVVTETQTIRVPVRREEVRIERVPLTDAETEPEAESDRDQIEVILCGEEVVVETRVVPRERVRLVREVVTTEETVTGEVRRERVDVGFVAPAPGPGDVSGGGR